jgi:hypothetical protein
MCAEPSEIVRIYSTSGTTGPESTSMVPTHVFGHSIVLACLVGGRTNDIRAGGGRREWSHAPIQ